MTEQQWPDEAVRAVALALAIAECARFNATPCTHPEKHRNEDPGSWGSVNVYIPAARAALAALAEHVVPRADDWEWGVHYGDWLPDVCADETHARLVADNDAEAVVVKRRAFVPAGPWEVAPDA